MQPFCADAARARFWHMTWRAGTEMRLELAMSLIESYRGPRSPLRMPFVIL